MSELSLAFHRWPPRPASLLARGRGSASVAGIVRMMLVPFAPPPDTLDDRLFVGLPGSGELTFSLLFSGWARSWLDEPGPPNRSASGFLRGIAIDPAGNPGCECFGRYFPDGPVRAGCGFPATDHRPCQFQDWIQDL